MMSGGRFGIDPVPWGTIRPLGMIEEPREPGLVPIDSGRSASAAPLCAVCGKFFGVDVGGYFACSSCAQYYRDHPLLRSFSSAFYDPSQPPTASLTDLLTKFDRARGRARTAALTEVGADLDRLILSSDELGTMLDDEFGISDFEVVAGVEKKDFSGRGGRAWLDLEQDLMRRRAERDPPDGNVVLEINEAGVVVGGDVDTRPTPADIARAVAHRGRLLHPNQAKSLVGYLKGTRPVDMGHPDPQNKQPGLLLLTLVVRQRTLMPRGYSVSYWIDDQVDGCTWESMRSQARNSNYPAWTPTPDVGVKTPDGRLYPDSRSPSTEFLVEKNISFTTDTLHLQTAGGGVELEASAGATITVKNVELDLGRVDFLRHSSLLYQHWQTERWKNAVRKLLVLGEISNIPEEVADKVLDFLGVAVGGKHGRFDWGNVAVEFASVLYRGRDQDSPGEEHFLDVVFPGLETSKPIQYI